MKILLITTFALLNIFISSAKAQSSGVMTYNIGGLSYVIDLLALKVGDNPSSAWADESGVNFLIAGTKQTRTASIAADPTDNSKACIAVIYQSSQFQLAGIVRHHSAHTVAFCNNYIAYAHSYGTAPLVVAITNSKEAYVFKKEELTNATMMNILGNLGMSYQIR